MHCKKVFKINGVGFNMDKIANVDIDVEKYKKVHGIPSDKTVLMSAGELSVRKNHISVVKALAAMKNKDNYVYCICGRAIAGSGTYEQIKELALRTNVHVVFMGWRKDMPQLFHCADIGIIPSLREGLGMAGVQQLAAGKPVIGSDVQGIRDYVLDGETGCRCNPYNPVTIKEAIIKLEDVKVRKAMSERCKEVAANFTKEISVRQRRTIYDEIL